MAKDQMAVSGNETEKKVKDASQDRKFPVETLRGNCVKLFGCTSSTFDGAFFNADQTKEYTIAEAKSIIGQWLGKEIGK